MATGAEATAKEITQARLATLGTLVAGIAHELNTPMGALKSNQDTIERALLKLGEILEDEVVTPDELVQVRRIVRATESVLRTNGIAVERMARLVRNLRNFGRPTTSVARPVDLHEGLEGTLALLGHALKGIEVVREFGELPLVVCLPNRINQVFMNLVHNAAQAMPDGGSLTITTRAEGKRVRIQVADTGRGIAPEDMAEIFEPGFTTKGERIGMGLGLAIVRQIVYRHGGDISFESEVGLGTTFEVLLPLLPPEDPGREEASNGIA